MTDGEVGEAVVETNATEKVRVGEGGGVRWARAVLGIAAREYRVAVRGRWAAGLAVLFGLFAVGIVAFGTSRVGPARYGAVIASLVELGAYLLPLVALAAGYDAVVGDEESGALDMLFALPVSRAQVVVGKYLGRAAVLGGAILVGLGAGGAVALSTVGLAGAGAYAAFVLAAAATGLAFLGVGVLISTVARERTHALAGALAAWAWFVLLYDLAAIGAVAALDLPGTAIAAMVLGNPADVFRVLVLSRLETAPGGFAAALVEAPLSTPILVAALAAWIVLPVAAATVAIRRRRL